MKTARKTKSKPKVVYGAAVNLGSMWGPVKLRLHEYGDCDTWYDESGDLSVDKIGLFIRAGFISFASTSKEEVELWASGVMCTMKMLARWADAGVEIE